MERRLGIYALVAVLLGGCSPLSFRSQSPEPVEETGPKIKLVGDLAVPFGMHAVEIESVGLVTGLDGTGSDPPPSPQRSALLADMQARGVKNPNQVLASDSTALVLVRGYLRPGIQKGDRFDIEVRIPSRSETTSLKGGWLMETRLKEMAVLNGRIRDGHTLALAEGAILVDPGDEAKSDKIMLGRGRVLGGGVAMKARPMGLVLKPGKQSVFNSGAIGAAVNRRFHTFVQGVKQGVATPKTDEYVEISVHARYKDNVARYMQVLRAISLRETPSQQMARVQLLQQQLLDPVTSATAAIRLEALGKDGIESLLKGLASSDAEVQFYAAEALAYQEDNRSVDVLVRMAREEPAFRVYAMTALSALDSYPAYEGLRSLLDAQSGETRYGAFRALWAMNPRDPLVRGEYLEKQFSYHVLNTKGPALIHVTRSFRPELVLFGEDQRFKTPLMLQAGKHILVTSKGTDEVTVSSFSVDLADQKRTVSTRVDDVIRAIVELGGTYPDVVQALQQAKATYSLATRLEVDALPQGGRTYERSLASRDSESGETETSGFVPDNPLPDLFPRVTEGPRRKRKTDWEERSDVEVNPEPKTGPWWRLFGKI